MTDLADWDAALYAAERVLAITTRRDMLPVTWRLRGCRAHALDQLGRTADAADDRRLAAADFDTLSGRIIDPVLRAWFVRQPLANRWLERPH